MAHKEIEVSDNQKKLLEQAGKRINECEINLNVARELLNQAANNADNLLNVICEAAGVEAMPGTRYADGKIIIPKPNRQARRKAKEPKK